MPGMEDNGVDLDRGKEERDLWVSYIANRDVGTRGRLIQRYLPLTQKIAAGLYAQRADGSVEFHDYLQYARIGLLEAIDRYDPSREAAFATYAGYRIRGAVLNALGDTSEQAAQRAYRRRVERQRVDSAKHDVRGKDLFEGMVDMAVSLALGHVLEDAGEGPEGVDDQAGDPYAMLEIKRMQLRICQLVELLPERERQIVKSHYFEHTDFSDIAVTLGVSTGRVSQLHARALRLVRDAYRMSAGFDVTY